MVTKYYYELEMCDALGYRSLNAVVYEADSELALQYKKVGMSCDAITNGSCKGYENCKVFEVAPKVLDSSYYLLRDKKIQ